MWILPKNYPLSSHFAQAMVERKEDLTLQGLNIESSLMSKSKPTRLRTWQTRWKQGSFYPHLFGRILKPCQYSLFETKLACLHLAIPANLLAQQEKEKEQMTPDTCGLTLGDTLNQLDLFSASLKTSKDISALDSEKSLATWKALVTEQRGEYSQRVKLALLTRESESTSWATPNTMDHLPQRSEETAEKFPTPGTTECRSDTLNLVNRVIKGKQIMLTHHVRLYPTPSARDWKDSPGMAKTAINPDGSERKRNDQLARAVYATENPITGHLNPKWVEWLMGVPTGWTELECWGMELCHKQPQKHGSHSTKELRH